MAIDESYFDQDWDHSDDSETIDESEQSVTLILKDAADRAINSGLKFILNRFDNFAYAFDMFRARSCKNCKPAEQLRFKTKTKSVSESDTPYELNVRVDHTLEVTVYSPIPDLTCSSCKNRGYPTSDGTLPNHPKSPSMRANTSRTMAKNANKLMSIAVKDETGYHMQVKMQNTTTMDFLMDKYSTQTKRELRTIRFFLDGERIAETDTPKKLGIVDGDSVEVFIEQIGG